MKGLRVSEFKGLMVTNTKGIYAPLKGYVCTLKGAYTPLKGYIYTLEGVYTLKGIYVHPESRFKGLSVLGCKNLDCKDVRVL